MPSLTPLSQAYGGVLGAAAAGGRSGETSSLRSFQPWTALSEKELFSAFPVIAGYRSYYKRILSLCQGFAPSIRAKNVFILPLKRRGNLFIQFARHLLNAPQAMIHAALSNRRIQQRSQFFQ